MADPLYRWLYPDEATPDGTGVAFWTAPGVELLDDPTPFLELLERWAPDRAEAAIAGMAGCGAYADPSEAVLHVLAVHPSRQGRGVAAQLLAPTLRELDDQKTSAYLDPSNARNLSFYRRAGFLPLGEVIVPEGGPTMYPLRRPPLAARRRQMSH